MSSDITPTQDDLSRDLRADLSELEGRDGRDYEAWVRDNADHAWPVAIRRALAAEAEVERLRAAGRILETLLADAQTRCGAARAALGRVADLIVESERLPNRGHVLAALAVAVRKQLEVPVDDFR